MSLGDLGNLDLSQLQQYLPNVNFPASKEEVASTAQSNDAPQEAVENIRNAGTDTFNSTDEVLQAAQGRL
jgi:D-aminopeptidase